MKTLYDINKTYPGVKSRKLKKKLKQQITYRKLGIVPVRSRKLDTTPRRGETVFTSSGLRGRFVGVAPTGKVWLALDEYREQFPYKLQCITFDNAWRKPIWNQCLQ